MATHKPGARALMRTIGAEQATARRLTALIEDTHQVIRQSEALVERSRKARRRVALWDEARGAEAPPSKRD